MSSIAFPIIIILSLFWFIFVGLLSGQGAFSQNSLICFGIFIFLSFSSNILLDKYTNSVKDPIRNLQLCESNLKFKLFLCLGSFAFSSYLFGEKIIYNFLK